mgnify:FL=1
MTRPYTPLYLAGQTGSGKTAVALALAAKLAPAEVINADAYQVYRGMETISAAPDLEEKALVPHHLFGVIDPTEECDAASFAKLARAKIEEVSTRALPLVVGGSGLYLKAITHGLAPTPKGDPVLRAELDSLSFDELISRYRQLDPEGAGQTNLKNRRYVTRNLEICLLTNTPASLIKQEWQDNQPDIRAYYLKRERDEVYQRINQRALLMFENGVTEEIRALEKLSATAEKAIGIRVIQSHLAGEIDRETCISAIQQMTRRYAKRQESWFKREASFQPIPVAVNDSPDQIAEKILSAH